MTDSALFQETVTPNVSACTGCNLFIAASLAVSSLKSDLGSATPSPTSFLVLTDYRLQSVVAAHGSGSGCVTYSGVSLTLEDEFSYLMPSPLPSDFTRSVAISFVSQLGAPTCSSAHGDTSIYIWQRTPDAVTSQFNVQRTIVPSSSATSTRPGTFQPSSVGVISGSQPTVASSSLPPPVNAGLSVGAKVGIGLGVSFFSLFLLAAVVGFVALRHRRHKSGKLESKGSQEVAKMPELEERHRLEINGEGRPPEFPSNSRYELDAGYDRSELRAEETAQEKT